MLGQRYQSFTRRFDWTDIDVDRVRLKETRACSTVSTPRPVTRPTGSTHAAYRISRAIIQYSRVWIRRWFCGLLLACGFLCSAVACNRELTAEETAFYERADKIKVGVTLETEDVSLVSHRGLSTPRPCV
jgi:hypothetical protein